MAGEAAIAPSMAGQVQAVCPECGVIGFPKPRTWQNLQLAMGQRLLHNQSAHPGHTTMFAVPIDEQKLRAGITRVPRGDNLGPAYLLAIFPVPKPGPGDTL